MATKAHPKSRYNAARRKAIREGTWHHNQPAEPVREHIRQLMNGPARLRIADVAQQSGVPYGTIKAFLYSGQETVIGHVASLILAVQADQPAARKLVDPTGTRRRLQALARMQWSLVDIGARLGMCGAAVSLLMSRNQLHETSAEKVRALYGEIGGTLGPSPRARKWAERNGWPSPMAWDDDTIDDPNAQPVGLTSDTDEPDGYDPITVGLAVDGRLTYEQLRAHRPDLIETIRRLAKSMTDIEIALHLHWDNGHSGICQIRSRNGIPNAITREVIAPTRARDRVRAQRRHARQAA